MSLVTVGLKVSETVVSPAPVASGFWAKLQDVAAIQAKASNAAIHPKLFLSAILCPGAPDGCNVFYCRLKNPLMLVTFVDQCLSGTDCSVAAHDANFIVKQLSLERSLFQQ